MNSVSCFEHRRCAAIRFWNTRPLVYGIESYFEFLTPAEIGNRFRESEWDVALVPVAELAGVREATIVDGVSISAWGPVQSVVLAHRVPLQEIRQIAIDPTSKTSVALLKILIKEFGLLGEQRPQWVEASEEARLFIGDQALSFRQQCRGEWEFLDLAEAWNRFTNLPMTFAVWVVGAGESDWQQSVAMKLRQTKAQGLIQLESLVASEENAAFLLRYFRESLRFDLSEPEKQGIRLFLKFIKKHDRSEPSLQYI